jgi:uncharacterized protein involved in outer membrane biogenesis
VIYKRRWIWTLVTLGAIIVIALAVIAATFPLRSASLQRKIVEALAERLNSDVTLEDVSLRLYPRLHAEGKGLLIRHRRRPDLPPLISVKNFTVDADLVSVLKKRVSHVEVFGLDITIPPKDENQDNRADRRDHRLHDASGAVATLGTRDNGRGPGPARRDRRAFDHRSARVQQAAEDLGHSQAPRP